MWIVNSSLKFDDLEDVLNYVFDPDGYDDEEEVDRWIDDMYEPYRIDGREFYASSIIKELDHYLYRDMERNWAEYQAEIDRECYAATIEKMSDGDTEYFGGCDIEYQEDEPEESEEVEEKFYNLVNW